MSDKIIIFGYFLNTPEMYIKNLLQYIFANNIEYKTYDLSEIGQVDFQGDKIFFIGSRIFQVEILLTIYYYFFYRKNEIYIYTDDIGSSVEYLKDKTLFIQRINKIYTSSQILFSMLSFCEGLLVYHPNIYYQHGHFIESANSRLNNLNPKLRSFYNKFRVSNLKSKNIGFFIDSKLSDEIINHISNFCAFISKNGFYITLVPKKDTDVVIINQITSLLSHSDHNFVSAINVSPSDTDYFYLNDCINYAFVMHSYALHFCMLKSVPFCALDHIGELKNALNNIIYPIFINQNEINAELMIIKMQVLENIFDIIKNYISARLNYLKIGERYINFKPNNSVSRNKDNIINFSYDFALVEYERIMIEKKNTFSKIDINNYAKYFSFLLTKDDDYMYEYFKDIIFQPQFNVGSEFKKCISDHKIKYPMMYYQNPNGFYNLGIFDQMDKSNVHRHGWRIVFDALVPYQNQYADTFIDLYVERTFLLKETEYKMYNVIPYKKKWYGFIHHTFNKLFGNSIEDIFKKKSFIESLPSCLGLFVLSVHLKNKLESFLDKLNTSIPVYCITHPTQIIQNKKFNITTFNSNSNKKIVHIGAWYRNLVSYYLVPLNYQKVALKGLFMDSYFPPQKYSLVDESDILSTPTSNYISRSTTDTDIKSPHENSDCNSKNRDCNSKNNLWLVFLKEYFSNLQNQVTIYQTVNNELYDDILSCNVVFINLVDASAVNTILECVTRNTPIIVNRIPATVEILGNNYPLFYNDQPSCTLKSIEALSIEINNMLNPSRIMQAIKYLQNIKTYKFDIGFFLAKFFDTTHQLNGII